MRKISLFIFCLLAFIACNNTPTIVDDLNESFADANQIEIETKAFDKQGRNLVYLLDPSCSFCVSNYFKFLNTLSIARCNYDSLYTIVLDDNYLMNVEYYRQRDNIQSKNERYIIDNDGDLTESYNELSGNNSILLLDNGRVAFATNAFDYRFEEGKGLVSQNKR